MQEHDDDLNRKVILLSVGSAAVAALLIALARRKEDEAQARRPMRSRRAPRTSLRTRSGSRRRRPKRPRKSRKRSPRQRPRQGTASPTRYGLRPSAWTSMPKPPSGISKPPRGMRNKQAKEAESRLRAAGHRVVDDATHLASWFGAEARNLAEEGKEKIAQLRHREERREHDRARGGAPPRRDRRAERTTRQGRPEGGQGCSRSCLRFAGKSGPTADEVASEATAAALGQIERALRAKAPALLAAKNRAQAVEILQKELGSTLRDTAVQAAVAALGKLDRTRESGDAVREAEDRAREAVNEARDSARRLGDDVADEVERAVEEAAHQRRDDAGERQASLLAVIA